MIHTFIFGCTPTIIIFAAKTKSFFGLNLKASGYWPKIREASVTLVICQAALEKEVHSRCFKMGQPGLVFLNVES